jgi:hypothetical protein
VNWFIYNSLPVPLTLFEGPQPNATQCSGPVHRLRGRGHLERPECMHLVICSRSTSILDGILPPLRQPPCPSGECKGTCMTAILQSSVDHTSSTINCPLLPARGRPPRSLTIRFAAWAGLAASRDSGKRIVRLSTLALAHPVHSVARLTTSQLLFLIAGGRISCLNHTQLDSVCAADRS